MVALDGGALRITAPDTLIASTVNNPKTGPTGDWVLSHTVIKVPDVSSGLMGTSEA